GVAMIRRLSSLLSGRRSAPSRPQSRPLTLERLDERDVPAVFHVTSAFDSGPGTLRQAIIDSNAAAFFDTIVIDGWDRIDLTSPLPALTDTCEIDGIPTKTIIEPAPYVPRFRIFNIYPNGELFILRNLHLQNGLASSTNGYDGGAIYSNG